MRTFHLNTVNARAAIAAINTAIAEEILEGGATVTVATSDKRTIAQNKKMWPMLNDIAKQVRRPVFDQNGEIATNSKGDPIYMDAEDWKDVITAGLASHQRIAAGLNGGVVHLGLRTRSMGKKKMAELIEFIYFVGAENNVVWSRQEDDSNG